MVAGWYECVLRPSRDEREVWGTKEKGVSGQLPGFKDHTNEGGCREAIRRSDNKNEKGRRTDWKSVSKIRPKPIRQCGVSSKQAKDSMERTIVSLWDSYIVCIL